MSINRQTDESAGLQIGPTSEGMVRIYVSGKTVDLPMDFDPDEAEEIADELRMAAQQARGQASVESSNGGKSKRKT
ncbi:MAG: DUF6324 family protein [Paracoccaceae bacterium]